jgi:hypothetical protein
MQDLDPGCDYGKTVDQYEITTQRKVIFYP